MKEKNPLDEEISKTIQDKAYGLPLKETLAQETYEQKKERFSKTEDFLAKLISETEDEKLMYTFLRWQELRNKLNIMSLTEIEKEIEKISSGSEINTEFKTEIKD
jgi:hypothetical protein